MHKGREVKLPSAEYNVQTAGYKVRYSIQKFALSLFERMLTGGIISWARSP